MALEQSAGLTVAESRLRSLKYEGRVDAAPLLNSLLAIPGLTSFGDIKCAI
jgi:hypothetical protein